MTRVLILDTSKDRSETNLTRRWVSRGVPVDAMFVEDGASFPDDLLDRGHTHVIHTGSAYSINDDVPFTAPLNRHVERYADRGVPQMGICYGHQLLCRALVGRHAVRRNPKGFVAGWRPVTFTERGRELIGVRPEEVVWKSHFDEVVEMPPGSELLAKSETTEVEAFLHEELRLFGTQFHPEFDEVEGNAHFAKERALLERHGIDVDAEIQGRPTLDAGRVLVAFFLDHFTKRS